MKKCFDCYYSVPRVRANRHDFLCLWLRQKCKKACAEWTPKKPSGEYAWSGEVKKRLEALIRLPAGWDGYQGTNVSALNASFALSVLEAVCGAVSRTPQIVPGLGQDLQIEWHTLQGDLEIHVRGPGDVHVWRAMAGGSPEGEELVLKNDFAVVARWVEEITEPDVANAPAGTEWTPGKPPLRGTERHGEAQGDS